MAIHRSIDTPEHIPEQLPPLARSQVSPVSTRGGRRPVFNSGEVTVQLLAEQRDRSDKALPGSVDNPVVVEPGAPQRKTDSGDSSTGSGLRASGKFRRSISLVATSPEGHELPDDLLGGLNARTHLDISGLPADIRNQLELFDTDGNGELDLEELVKAATTYKELQSDSNEFSLECFPKYLRNELEVFDADNDGKFSADEIIRACRMYTTQRSKLQTAVKALLFLCVLLLFFVLINGGLTFMVVHLTKEVTAQDDGLLFTDKTNQIVSTGKAATVVELLADNHAFSRLLGRNCSRSEHVCKNHLSVKPDGAGIVFSAGTYEIFPCDFMKVTEDEVVIGNVKLGVRIVVTQGRAPQLLYDSDNISVGGNISQTKDVAEKQFAVLLRLFVSLEAPANKLGDWNGHDSQEKLDKLAAQISGAGETATTKRMSEADAISTNHLVDIELARIPLQDMSLQIQQHPVASRTEHGIYGIWMLHFDANSPVLSSDSEYGQLCTFLQESGGACSELDRAEAIVFNAVKIDMDHLKLNSMLDRADMSLERNPYGITLVSKVFNVNTPSYSIVSEKEADAHQHRRRGQVKETVFSTFRGRHILHHLRKLRHVASSPAGRRRLSGLFVTEGSTDFLSELDESLGSECFTKDIPYRGNVSVDEYNIACQPWSEEEIAQYSDILSSSTPAHCRQLDPRKRPQCPIFYGGVRQLSPCRIDHCAELLYYYDSKANSRTIFNKKTWGLDRIQSVLPTYDFDHDPNDLGGNGVECYIVDSGVNLNHVEFNNKGIEYDAIEKTDFQYDGFGHGTHVAGIVAGHTTGVAPGCRVHAIKVLNNAGHGGHGSEFFGLKKVLDHWNGLKAEADRTKRAQPRGVVNLSLGTSSSDAKWANAVAELQDAGLVVVAAAGNQDRDACGYSPAQYPQSITVGATNMDDTKAIFSNWGACVQIYAPGNGIKSASHRDNNGYLYMSGTSMAAPFVSGAAALFLQANPSLKPKEVARLLFETAVHGRVHGLDYMSTNVRGNIFTSMDDSFAKFQAFSGVLGFEVSDEHESLEKLHFTSRLLHVGNVSTSELEPPKTCSKEQERWSDWSLSEEDCPRRKYICSTSRTVEWNGKEYNQPLLVKTRRCADSPDCVCENEVEEGIVECDKVNQYEFLAGCGAPAAVIENDDDTSWLEGKRLKFFAKDETALDYDVCESEFEDTLPFPVGRNSLLDRLSANLAGQTTVSLPSTFKFRSSNRRSFGLQAYSVMTVYSNGHLKFGVHQSSRFRNFRNFDLESHRAKGAGISALFTGFDLHNCSFPSPENQKCGDIRTFETTDNGRRVFVISFINVISKHAPFDLPKYRSTFQVVLYLGTSEFHLIYKKISTTAQGKAVYGVSLGPGSHQDEMSPRRSLKCSRTGSVI